MKFKYQILYVDDVPRSLEFFKNAFGFDIGFIHEGNDYGELITGETKLCFSSHALMESMGKSTIPADPATPSFEIALESENVAHDYKRAVDAGAKPISEPAQMEWGQIISYVACPDGFLIEICSPVG